MHMKRKQPIYCCNAYGMIISEENIKLRMEKVYTYTRLNLNKNKMMIKKYANRKLQKTWKRNHIVTIMIAIVYMIFCCCKIH